MREKKNINQEPATKGDLKALATKADLNGVKADLNGVKADLNGVKADLNGVKADLSTVKTALSEQAMFLLKLERKFETFSEALRQTKSEILSAVDAFAKDTKEVERDTALQSGHLADHDRQLKNHENRLKKLETVST
ncbi:MAG: hypothetical protein HY547_02985 [Elusimicrobia bacterium]|nr:hypothetical protein [Elusimicrobiota bacterium]